jgi:hypothetical protein
LKTLLKAFRPRWHDLALLVLAVILNAGPVVLIPLSGYGTYSFASAAREIRIGMTYAEWHAIEKKNGVEASCDATDCHVYDLLRGYNVNFDWDEHNQTLRARYVRTFVHPFGNEWYGASD